jgi:coenzyme Q-binding protein COQ10
MHRQGDPPVHLEAELKVGFLGMDESYTSKVECKPFESVQVSLIYQLGILVLNLLQAVASSSTPLFTDLITTWGFLPASSHSPHQTSQEGLTGALPPQPAKETNEEAPTLLTFDISFAFASPIHAAISKGFFGRVSSMMVTAFEERCLEVYGPRKR